MHSNSNKVKFISYNDANEVADDLFKSLISRYQNNLQRSVEGSEHIFDSVRLMYCKYHSVNFRHVGSYIFSQDWIKAINVSGNG